MVKLKENNFDYIDRDDAVYADGSFVDFAKSVRRNIESEKYKGRYKDWSLEYYFVPEKDSNTGDIRNDSFALVFTKNGKNMFYIETFLTNDRFNTTLTCPILGIDGEPVSHCSGNSKEIFYSGGFNSHNGFGSMVSNYIYPTMKKVENKLSDISGNSYYSGVYESKKTRIKESDFNGYDYKSRYEMALNIANWAFYEPLDPQELGVEDNLEFLWDKYYSSKAGNLDAKTDEDVFFSCESAEELAEFLAKSSVNTLRHMEIDLGIDEDTIKAENGYFLSHANERRSINMKLRINEKFYDGVGHFCDYKSDALGKRTLDKLETLGWDKIYQNNDARYPRAYVYKTFNGEKSVTIYIGEWGSVFVKYGNDKPIHGEQDFYVLVDTPANFLELQALDELGKNLSSGMDFDEAEDIFFRS